MQEIKNKIDPSKVRQKEINITYPNIYIKKLSNYVVVVINALEEGSIPLLATHKGETKIVKHVSRSVYNIHKLLRVTDLEVKLSKEDVVSIKSVLDYMEVLSKWI